MVQKIELSPEELLAEIDDLLRTVPSHAAMLQQTKETLEWQGRAAAIMARWDIIQAANFDAYLRSLTSFSNNDAHGAWPGIMRMLHRARTDLRLKIGAPITVALGHGKVHDYFDEVRKIIEQARTDMLFVDPYLDAEFVTRYLPHVHKDAVARLLTTGKSRPQLLSAVDMLAAQTGLKAEVRITKGLHDRYLFVDNNECYQSGASFKDGAKHSPTILTRVVDAFPEMLRTYQNIWAQSDVAR